MGLYESSYICIEKNTQTMRTKRLIRLIIWSLLLVLCLFLRIYYPIEGTESHIRIIHTILSLCILLLSFRVIINFMILLYRLEQKNDTGRMKDNLIVGLSNLFSIFSFLAIILGLLSLLGLSLEAVFTTLSIVAAAIAIVTKEFIAEIIVGIINGFSRKIELDDYVKVGDQKGKIIDIGLTKMTLLNDDDDIVYIPNVKFYNTEVINYTKRELPRMSVDFQLDLQYVNNFEQLESELIQSLAEFHDQIEPESYNLKISNISKDSIDCKFQYTLKRVSRDLQRQIRKFTLKKIITYISHLKHQDHSNHKG